jgi:hypothetical protein
MVLYKGVVLYISYKKDKNRRVCTKFINLDLGLYKGGILFLEGGDSTTDNTVTLVSTLKSSLYIYIKATTVT